MEERKDDEKGSAERRLRLLIADDRPLSRAGLRALLGTCPRAEVVGEAADGEEAVRLAGERSPDVVLMDVRMPGMGGLEAIRLIKALWPRVRIVALTLYGGYRCEATAAGADAFLVKGCPAEDLLEAIKAGGSSTPKS